MMTTLTTIKKASETKNFGARPTGRVTKRLLTKNASEIASALEAVSSRRERKLVVSEAEASTVRMIFQRGVPRVDDRRVVNGIFWVLRSCQIPFADEK
jgi:hypothetical protein